MIHVDANGKTAWSEFSGLNAPLAELGDQLDARPRWVAAAPAGRPDPVAIHSMIYRAGGLLTGCGAPMAVFKSYARLVDASGTVIGEGHAYVHLRQGELIPQTVQGTVSLRRWQADAAAPSALELPDGRRLLIRVQADTLSTCLGSCRILRYHAEWPPHVSDE